MNMLKKTTRNNISSWLKYLGLTAQLLTLLALATYGGIFLDKKFQISPALTIALPLLVLGGSFYMLFKETTNEDE